MPAVTRAHRGGPAAGDAPLSVDLLLAALATLLLAVPAGLVAPRRARVPLVAVVGGVGCALAIAAAAGPLSGGTTGTFATTELLALGGLDLRLDALGALFVVLAAGVGLASLLYAAGYLEGAAASRPATSLLALFVLSLIAVPAAGNVVTFLFAWELMALSSLGLLLVEQRERPAARAAALWYAVMTQGGAAAITLGLLLASRGATGARFVDLATHVAHLSPGARAAALVLVLVGFSSKAGAVPLHVWLPKAHPEAPTPVSALMSGVMVALGIYGLVRIGLEVLGPTRWAGAVLIVLGALSALYGAMHAAATPDLKRLLAYSTVDVMGLVLIGLGAAETLAATGHGPWARVAVAGALFLVVAHGGFKACLFLAAGHVERVTGTRDLDRLGGLSRVLPVTTALFAVASLSIVAVPALSGFVGEWLVLESLLAALRQVSGASIAALLVGLSGLALCSGLTAVGFVKALGVGFLGRARGPVPDQRERVGVRQLSMGLLALSVPVLGLWPGPLVRAVSRIGASLVTSAGASHLHAGASALNVATTAFAPLQLAALIVAGALVARAVAARRVRSVEPWNCGRASLSPRMQYTATSFAEPLQRVFSDVLRPDNDVDVTHSAESAYALEATAYRTRIDDSVERHLYRPVLAALRATGRRAAGLQDGNLHRYLALGLVALIVVLAVLS